MPRDKIASPHTTAVLKALQWQGSTNNCGPFTTATVLNASRGLGCSGSKLAQLMNKPVWRGWRPVIRRIPNWATFPWGMVDVLREHGLNARWRFFAGEDDLRQGLEQGWLLMPIIGTWKPLWAHVMTLLAWDSDRGWGFANTGINQRSLYWIPDWDFIMKWRAMGKLLVMVKDVITLDDVSGDVSGGTIQQGSGGQNEF
jgi:hypothetical protein